MNIRPCGHRPLINSDAGSSLHAKSHDFSKQHHRTTTGDGPPETAFCHFLINPRRSAKGAASLLAEQKRQKNLGLTSDAATLAPRASAIPNASPSEILNLTRLHRLQRRLQNNRRTLPIEPCRTSTVRAATRPHTGTRCQPWGANRRGAGTRRRRRW